MSGPSSDPVATESIGAPAPRILLLACGALLREVRSVLGQLGKDARIDVEYLPANLHNRPEKIPGEVVAVLDREAAAGASGRKVVLGYADCGTGGLLDAALVGRDVARLPGAHCYAFFAGQPVFDELQEEEPGTFYLTDFLARHFEQLVIVGLGIDRHPQLRDAYFGNYRRVVLLSQTDDSAIATLGREAATRLGLAFEHRHVGMAPFSSAMDELLSAHTNAAT